MDLDKSPSFSHQACFPTGSCFRKTLVLIFVSRSVCFRTWLSMHGVNVQNGPLPLGGRLQAERQAYWSTASPLNSSISIRPAWLRCCSRQTGVGCVTYDVNQQAMYTVKGRTRILLDEFLSCAAAMIGLFRDFKAEQLERSNC